MEGKLIKSREPKPLRYSADTFLADVRYYRNPECFEVIGYTVDILSGHTHIMNKTRIK